MNTKINDKEIRRELKMYIEENMEVFDENIDLRDNDNIFEKGFVSSIFAMRLLTFIESTFKTEVKDEDINLANFSSIDNIVRMLEK